MPFYQVMDWNDAYAIEPYIVGATETYAKWADDAAAFRKGLPESRKIIDLRYGDAPRNLMDIFLPETAPRGLAVFIHGGYWMECDKDLWSHYAAGALAHGLAVCMPGYTLCPEARISGIAAEVATAVSLAARRFAGPITLSGHSAGGHLASRLVSGPALLPPDVRARLTSLVSISGLHDLRPLLNTDMNGVLSLDMAEAQAESPGLLIPAKPLAVTCWVGSAERAEFLRQSRLLADAWAGLGCATRVIVEPDRHHFNVIDGLLHADHPLTRAFTDLAV